jgi:hypothetical protein
MTRKLDCQPIAPLFLVALSMTWAGWLCMSAAAQEGSDSGCSNGHGSPIGDTPCLYYGCVNNLTGERWSEYSLPANPVCTTLDGRVGKTLCEYIPNLDHMSWGQLNWSCPPTAPVTESGSVLPKYLILTVVYAPPGSQDCKFTSMVAYGEGNTLGTTVSATKSLASGTKVSVGVSLGGEVGPKGEIGASFAFGNTSSDSDEMSISNKTGSAINASGPCSDGINHDFDRVYLLLSPEVPLLFSDPAGCESCGEEEIVWSLSPTAGTQYEVYVGELKGTMPMRQSTLDIFAAHNITGDDQWTILNANPLAFWSGTSMDVPDPDRFVRTTRSLEYAAPVPGTPPDSHDYYMENETMTKSVTSSELSYSVGASVSGSNSFLGLASAKFSVEQTWTWTNSNSAAFSESRSTSASVSIGSPSEAFQGAPAIAIYYDTIFKTYAFVPSF